MEEVESENAGARRGRLRSSAGYASQEQVDVETSACWTSERKDGQAVRPHGTRQASRKAEGRPGPVTRPSARSPVRPKEGDSQSPTNRSRAGWPLTVCSSSVWMRLSLARTESDVGRGPFWASEVDRASKCSSGIRRDSSAFRASVEGSDEAIVEARREADGRAAAGAESGYAGGLKPPVKPTFSQLGKPPPSV